MDQLPQLIEDAALRFSSGIALAAPGRVPISYGQLVASIGDTRSVLRSAGLGRDDRVAVVLPNGPEMAAAFLAVASCTTCAPLNPAYRSQ